MKLPTGTVTVRFAGGMIGDAGGVPDLSGLYPLPDVVLAAVMHEVEDRLDYGHHCKAWCTPEMTAGGVQFADRAVAIFDIVADPQ